MCKEDVVLSVAAQAGITKKVAEGAVNAFIDTVIGAMQSGEQVSINQFGVFALKLRKGRVGRNFHTGEPIKLPDKMVPTFTPSESLIGLFK